MLGFSLVSGMKGCLEMVDIVMTSKPGAMLLKHGVRAFPTNSRANPAGILCIWSTSASMRPDLDRDALHTTILVCTCRGVVFIDAAACLFQCFTKLKELLQLMHHKSA